MVPHVCVGSVCVARHGLYAHRVNLSGLLDLVLLPQDSSITRVELQIPLIGRNESLGSLCSSVWCLCSAQSDSNPAPNAGTYPFRFRRLSIARYAVLNAGSRTTVCNCLRTLLLCTFCQLSQSENGAAWLRLTQQASNHTERWDPYRAY